ncbi:MAG: glycoside hydrolase family 125 protein [Microbacterium sp.]
MTSALHASVAAAIGEVEGSGLMRAVADAFPGSGVPGLAGEALRRTLADTLTVRRNGDVFVVTGDIPAMWLRDSSAQLWPYVLLARERPAGAVADLVAGAIRQQLAYIAHDPYANAFNLEASGDAYHADDLDRDPLVWERKFEIDSLCFPILLAQRLWSATRRTDFLGDAADQAFRRIMETLERETDHERLSAYRFVREGADPRETLPRGGLGSPVAVTGMAWSGFRPSDDACAYGYNVPGNLFASSALALIPELTTDPELADRARRLSASLHEATMRHGTVPAPGGGTMLAYEVDGRGNALLMDDANLPSLLGLPLLTSIGSEDDLYLRTRRFTLSAENPHFYAGSAAAGIGSPHTPVGHVWPIALAVEGLTSTDPREKRLRCEQLSGIMARTGHMHESFHVDDPGRYTRDWFSWADSMFCLLASDVAGLRI